MLPPLTQDGAAVSAVALQQPLQPGLDPEAWVVCLAFFSEGVEVVGAWVG